MSVFGRGNTFVLNQDGSMKNKQNIVRAYYKIGVKWNSVRLSIERFGVRTLPP